MRFIYHQLTHQLFNEEGEITPTKFDEKGHPYWVWPDNKQHWLKCHLYSNNGRAKRIFYKNIDRYYRQEFTRSYSRRRKIITFDLGDRQEVIKQVWGWELKIKPKPRKK
ncbi:MAG: hypothetical protein MRERV_28c003 [Mycoplasmataceae bacterium RV_VA103A]|nr:MAG: hypothetical protein MRERV_28c003 [Mycoplasmataceae bacterium RV_VA103A]